ncbi:MAG: thiolase family protein [Candidatus Dormibacteraeota bacterium]|uniref:acetyl-CoA C-acetyltransferase n=1 Tax=Candidatus Dormiibacter inghamiae TaxID=3127013 RepID=A0A934KEK1_9BACT|nr:thiolase family protein [Candidatus Dormibacteraeota bacterium]MBJ7605835.1 thiolase family protein [Candidatus Dormibacteraeota bacterium]
MKFEQTYIPYGGYWSTPFARWQGSLAQQHPIQLAAAITRSALAERGIDAKDFQALFLGTTVPSPQSFYGAPWLAGLIGNPDISGPTVMQACATSARIIADAAVEVDAASGVDCILAIAADRTSNGPHIYYPDASGPGGRGVTEDWVWDNFQNDPFAQAGPMAATAENVAEAEGISREEQDEVTLLRYEQYAADRTADGNGFLSRYLVPVELGDPSGRKVIGRLNDDEGIFPTTAEGLARMKPVRDGGTVTYGSQTHPADGNCGLVLAGRKRAREMSRDRSVEVQLLSFGQARVKAGFMPTAPVPAARAALAAAGLGIEDMAAVKTHNPFAVNDVYFSREFDLPLDSFNNHGSSLVFGHPQGPTGMRLLIELVEELAERGGGRGLFSGCAAGDTGAALVVKVDCGGR